MIKTLKNFSVKEKKVLLRVDLNVPINNGKILDRTRLHIIKSTVEELCSKKNKVFLWVRTEQNNINFSAIKCYLKAGFQWVTYHGSVPTLMLANMHR